MRKSDIALELFNEGYNCAQAVLSAFDEEIGLDRKTAIKISCEYGAGMAKGGTCGAVMGALMVLEFKLKQNNSGNSNLEELVFNAQGNLKINLNILIIQLSVKS
ncbi:putative redox-active protein, CGCAxxGCC motif family [Gottschalkia acidurici 9a]|uniref:Redox-active protein, CGCAxxGCC motif family n=1 Tax=Gottschalkia acidurici (strain ATCC 7906 / DSM 604 / BCRC 14475 / CIP 104303 / KCTC 5404 / NCIMB 10678 / 9a) TaxID=1128398 RepID=K0B2L3_GOTA9|nr:C-GCAxxG-C-C family protein [Gottschalkia acidurici]AFS79180.1 putative redox-active protein, CGCAxxGCC motif family [Gottschalkia acidurici 9a]